MNAEQKKQWLGSLKVGDKVCLKDPENRMTGTYAIISYARNVGQPIDNNTGFILMSDTGKKATALGGELLPTDQTTYPTVWDAISGSPEEAAKMTALSEGMMWLEDEEKKLEAPLSLLTDEGVLLTGQISKVNMEMLFSICRINKIDTSPLEAICKRYGQPIP